MRAPRIALAALALASAAACGPPPVETSSGGSVTPVTPQPMSSMAGMHYNATLASTNGSSVRGTAMIHSMNGKQTVELQVTGGPPSAVLPWHIHSGSCADGMTPIVGNPALYTGLGTSTDGSASLMTELPIDFAAGQRYHVNVHASPSDMGTIVACGDITTG